jgi:hypothetical protein
MQSGKRSLTSKALLVKVFITTPYGDRLLLHAVRFPVSQIRTTEAIGKRALKTGAHAGNARCESVETSPFERPETNAQSNNLVLSPWGNPI